MSASDSRDSLLAGVSVAGNANQPAVGVVEYAKNLPKLARSLHTAKVLEVMAREHMADAFDHPTAHEAIVWALGKLGYAPNVPDPDGIVEAVEAKLERKP